ncbi:Hypothetical protein Bdt_0309 [Bdellovibrio bacteriovorus str. Tiberius]|uniref:Uncharacterized protein n=1 Tax=Bdellovibrio bacteriovorus str. Tiberius TaxID=1069642 RepID=K7YR41_BDEBC|nr:Hypothetical protein Bdt_0309 [Bdellovibrio bacteriovorus str. Tiberius]
MAQTVEVFVIFWAFFRKPKIMDFLHTEGLFEAKK